MFNDILKLGLIHWLPQPIRLLTKPWFHYRSCPFIKWREELVCDGCSILRGDANSSVQLHVAPSYLGFAYVLLVNTNAFPQARHDFLDLAFQESQGNFMISQWSQKLKPWSDIRCNRFATSPRLTLSTNRRGRNKVPDRSRRGCREVGN